MSPAFEAKIRERGQRRRGGRVRLRPGGPVPDGRPSPVGPAGRPSMEASRPGQARPTRGQANGSSVGRQRPRREVGADSADGYSRLPTADTWGPPEARFSHRSKRDAQRRSLPTLANFTLEAASRFCICLIHVSVPSKERKKKTTKQNCSALG